MASWPLTEATFIFFWIVDNNASDMTRTSVLWSLSEHAGLPLGKIFASLLIDIFHA